MGFLSFKFILFLGVTFFAYFVVPKRFQWLVLLLFSYAYYFLNSKLLIAVLIAESAFVFLICKALSSVNRKIKEIDDKEIKKELKKKNKLVLAVGIIGVLGTLIVIKYSDFIIENINALLHGNISLFNFVLPLGISFYTLQAISYMIDVSKGKYECNDNILHFMLYMSYFPQIIQGPIPRYNRLAKQLFEEHDYDYDRVTRGLQLMFWGIAKKVIIADRLAKPVSYLFENYTQFTGISILLGAVCYSFQIYADFSGGIDAIRGISEVFGIGLDENFRQPYFSKSIEEFWRRWHITLGSWMKDYVFYPLSLSKPLNRLGKSSRKILGEFAGKRVAPCIATFVVYLLVGIWHGASWKYVAYGIWNGVIITCGIMFDGYKKALETFRINGDSKAWNLFRMIRTFLICSIGRIFSRATDLPAAFSMFRAMFTRFFDLSFIDSELFEALGLNVKNWLLLVIAVFIVMLIDCLKEKGIDVREAIAKKPIVLRWMIYYLLILAILVFGLYGGGYDASTFIYGRF